MTQLNNLHADGIALLISTDGIGWDVDVKYISDDGKYEDGEYLDGYTGLGTAADALFLSKAYIAGYQLAIKERTK